ncbi:MAG: 2'-deoxycytidine 5'-triphosphate deaminase [Alphaproteobacteria bacterium]|nr:2'-deoxycytidine 5'-triphosphate deaminase [Alphaproteobacteria bacterium]
MTSDGRSDVETLFPDQGADEAERDGDRSTGILPSQRLRAMVHERAITATEEIGEDQIQPASIDLRLGAVAYRVRASFLPAPGQDVEAKLERLNMHEIDLTRGAVLEQGCVYIVPLMEHVRLGYRTSGIANPKSSTGRLNVFSRVITNGGLEFDVVRPGYRGPLYAEISPRGFSVIVCKGSRLVQLRLRSGSPRHSVRALRELRERDKVVSITADDSVDGGFAISVDLRTAGPNGIIGWRARRHTDVVDIDLVGAYDPAAFWEPVSATMDDAIILDPSEFYILASENTISVPPDYAAEMAAYDTQMGEFRVHYAGFFDPGFGHDEAGGGATRAVLEVRSHEVPFLIEHGQILGRLLYERLTARPDKLYGGTIGSSYQRQGLALSKQFRRL